MSVIPPRLLPRRPREAHKGDAGRVLIIAGSRSYAGAAALCATGALRAGAGLVTLGVPKSLHAPMVEKLTESMFLVLPETKGGSLSASAFPQVLAAIEKADAVAIGPGLSQDNQTKSLVRELLPKVVKPLVLDADGLNALAEDIPLLMRRELPAVLTPHPGEMGRLIRLSAAEVERDRERIASEFAKKYRVVLVLKGPGTVVANFDGQTYINETGNPGLASGGSGDVLTGVIAGLLGQGLEWYDAARLGVYLHGLAADLAVRERGEIGLIASDVAATIPLAINVYQES